MRLTFAGEIWEWRGPAPFHFVTVPEEESAEIEAAAHMVTYGWGHGPGRRADRRDRVHDGALAQERRLRPARSRTGSDARSPSQLGDEVTVRLTLDC